LSWVAHQLPADALHLFDANIFYPEPRTLAYSDAMLATALMAAPLLWAGVPQVIVYNLLVLLSFAASGIATYALVRRLTGDRWAAAVAGAAFAFFPYRLEHYSHLELLVTFWMPLALLMLHRTIESRRTRDGVVTGVLVALQTLSSLYYGLFLIVMMAVLWAVETLGGRQETGGQHGLPRVEWRRVLAPWLPAALVLGLLVAPISIPYLQNHATLGDRFDWRIYSATPRSYLVAPHLSRVYGGWLSDQSRPETSLFPGIAIVVLAAIGACAGRDARRTAYVAAAFVMFDGSLGANGVVFPVLRDLVLPFRGLRAPARFSVLLGLALSVLAGYAVHRLRQSRRLQGRKATVVTLACAVVLLVEYLPGLHLVRLPLHPPPVYEYFRGAPPAVLADLPFPSSMVEAARDARFMYFSTFHWKPLVNGYSGFSPPSYQRLLDAAADLPDAAAVAELRQRGVTHVVVHGAFYAPHEYEYVVSRLDESPHFERVTLARWQRHETRLYRLVPPGGFHD